MATEILLVIASLVIVCCLAKTKNYHEVDNKKPNIVIILADDMGFDDISFRGSNEFLTPNIDALAYHGMILDRLYAPAMCTPSRSALMTGKYPIHTGTQHFVISNEAPWSLPTNIPTIADIFRQAGYSTNLIGKWHLGLSKKEFTPTYRGFDYHYGYLGSYIDYYKRKAKMPEEGFGIGYDFRRNLEIECDGIGTYVTDLLTNEAERLISNHNKTTPLLLILNHLAPHTANTDDPLQAPESEIQNFKYIQNHERRIYAAMVSKLDKSIGRVITALDQNKMLNNSIVIFYSDNGAPSIGMFSNTGSNWPLRGQKNTPWEGGVRVAGCIWSPLLKKRSHIWKQNIYVGDWLPTLADAAKIELDPKLELDGINLWNELSNGLSDTERSIVHNLDDIDGVASYMKGNLKYINGTTLNGFASNVVTFREEYDIDPRNAYYSKVILDSEASQALKKYDLNRLTQKKIRSLRAMSGIQCNRVLERNPCNPLVEECLFRIDEDPCELNNLAWKQSYSAVMQEMRNDVKKYRKKAMKPRNTPGLPEFDPSRHQCSWTWYLDEPPNDKGKINCKYAKLPCLEK